MVRKLGTFMGAAIVAFIAGCSTTGTGEGSLKQPFTPHVDREELDPLLDAPLRTRTTCTGKELFSAGNSLGGFSFVCPDLDVIATLNELRDAGWRVEEMNIGRTEVTEDQTGAALTCVLRKVY